MKYKAPGKCPVCGEKLEITKLNCPKCSTSIEGEFIPCRFCRLPKDELEFINTFIMCRGNIKDVEKELGISYPTVRSKLDTVIKSLGLEDENKKRNEKKESTSRKEDSINQVKELKQQILDKLASGELTTKEAMDKIKELKI